MGTAAVAVVVGLAAGAGAQPGESGHPASLGQALAEGKLEAHFRLYSLDRLFEGDQVVVPRSRNKALALGGWVGFQTKPYHGLSVSLGGSGSLPLHTHPENDGTSLLSSGQQGYSVVHQAFVQLDVGSTSLRAGRQSLSTPLLTTLDNRMTPIMFEAFTAQGRPSEKVSWLVSHVTGFLRRGTTEFVAPSTAVGWDGNEPVTLVGATWQPGEGVTLQLWDFYSHEMMNAPYGQVDVTVPLGRGWSVTASLQGLYERSVGREIAGELDTGFGAVQLAFTKMGFNGHGSYSRMSRQGMVIFPWSQNPDFTAPIEEDQDLAGERAWAWGFSWDFTHVGVPGLVVMWDRTRAYVPHPPVGMSQKQQYEYQAIVDYSFEGRLQGFKARLLGAWVSSSLSSGSIYGQDYHDYRAILYYNLTTTPGKLFTR